MKKTQIYNVILLLWLLILPFLSFTVAADKPDYVGISENDVIIWKTTIDEDPYGDFLEDDGWSEAAIEAELDLLFDDQFDEDVEAWKYVILEIKDEKEYDLDTLEFFYNLDDEEYDGVPYLYNLYITENLEAEDWEDEETNERDVIYKYDRDLYSTRADSRSGMFRLIISKNVNWKRVVREVDERFDDKYEDAGAKRPETPFLFFFEQEADGIVTFRDFGEDPLYLNDVEEFEATSIYTDDGILRYYEWTYDGDPIIIFELQDIIENYVIANLWTIVIVSAVALVIIVVIVILIKRR